MDYTRCKLYGIKRKRDLSKLIKFDYSKVDLYNRMYNPYIKKKGYKKRIIEAPCTEVKGIQKRIKKYLDELIFPNYVFSGIKGKSYFDNATFHKDNPYVLKIDMSKFYPNINRNKIYKFYNEKLNCSKDVSNILTNLSSINLSLISTNEINEYLKENDIKCFNHLPSGSPLSSMLSYLVNEDMFSTIYSIVKYYKSDMTIYVDDIVVSSQNIISPNLYKVINCIAKKSNVKLNHEKKKYYDVNDYKKITGCVYKNGIMYVPNKIRYKINENIKFMKVEDISKDSILGLISCARLVNKLEYQNLLCFVKKKNNK